MNPLRAFAGLAQNQRGNAILIDSPNLVPFNNQKFVVLQADSKDSDPEQVTVTLGLETSIPVALTGTLFINHVANLEWGVGGASYQAQIDWVKGTIVSFPASFVRVSVIPAENPASATTQFRFSASAAYGDGNHTPNRGRLTTTVRNASLLAGGGTSEYIEIPAFAVGFNLMCGTTGAGPFEIQVTGNQAPLDHQSRFVWSNNTNLAQQKPDTFPLMAGSRQLRITNNGVAVTYLYILWEIAL